MKNNKTTKARTKNVKRCNTVEAIIKRLSIKDVIKKSTSKAVNKKVSKNVALVNKVVSMNKVKLPTKVNRVYSKKRAVKTTSKTTANMVKKRAVKTTSKSIPNMVKKRAVKTTSKSTPNTVKKSAVKTTIKSTNNSLETQVNADMYVLPTLKSIKAMKAINDNKHIKIGSTKCTTTKTSESDINEKTDLKITKSKTYKSKSNAKNDIKRRYSTSTKARHLEIFKKSFIRYVDSQNIATVSATYPAGTSVDDYALHFAHSWNELTETEKKLKCNQ